MSETSACRSRLIPYCLGNGLDLGFGGDPISSTAICIDRGPNHHLRAVDPNATPTHIVGDVTSLYWFADGVLDFVFSSHCLEDFQDTKTILMEWLRVIKPGGYLVLYLPDQTAYEAHCFKHGTLPNQAHIHAHFSLFFVVEILHNIGIKNTDIVHSLWPVPNNPYSFDLVIKKPV